MQIKDLLKIMFRAYFVIATGATISMYLCSLLFSPNANFSPGDIGVILLAALASDLSLFIFYSKKELNKKKMLLRFFIHIPMTIVILLLFAKTFNWIDLKNVLQLCVFILLALGVYASVVAVTFYQDTKMAEKLNAELKRRYPS